MKPFKRLFFSLPPPHHPLSPQTTHKPLFFGTLREKENAEKEGRRGP